MAWLAVDEDGQEVLFASCPRRNGIPDRNRGKAQKKEQTK